MKCQRLTFSTTGNPADVLGLTEFDATALQPGEVLLEIHASPINPADLNYIEGTYGVKPELPSGAGIECYATVAQSRSDKFSEGDPVIPIARIGGWASHAVTSEENLIRIPSGLDPLQAAMLKVNPATAWLLLNQFESLREGDWVALNASNSGVGQCVAQLAALIGVRTLCFLRNTKLAADLTALGATSVLEDSAEGFAQARELLGKSRAKIALNAVGGDSALRLMKLLGEGGTHITYGAMGRKPLTVPNGPLIFGDIRLRGLWVTKWIENAPRGEVADTYRILAGHMTEGLLRQETDSTYPLAKHREALARLSAPERRGKVLFLPGSGN
ncbi:zinc-binding dehydrogenase [Akkermansiaceae bacterium]|nr:zinc-binding dehydrogenase [Akkermansiaceae bacterium]